jgi:hypothetical protein
MRIRVIAVTSAVALAVLVGAPAAADPPIPLLTGSDLRIDGLAVSERLGAHVATGDVNGDGIADALYGAPGAGNNSRPASGSVYVVFGSTPADPVDLGNLGSRGFRIDGPAASTFTPASLATADFNGDGKDDVLIGVQSAGSGGTGYVVFGRTATSSIDLNNLGTAGVRIDAAASGDSLGADVADLGDLNGDGRDDIAIGANQGDSGGANSGTTYVVLGRTSKTTINVGSLGIGGFTIQGAAPQENSGAAVANAGDVNADGRDDLVIGAFGAGANSRLQSGTAYVVFGQAVPGDVDLSSLGSAGYRIDGAATGDFLGFSVAGIGDINNDGKDDMALGAPNADFAGGSSGSTYVILGRTSPSNLDLAGLGPEGFRIDGAGGSDQSGSSVAGGADLNDDGTDDLLICAPQAKHSFNLAGAAYAVFGGSDVSNRLLANIGGFGVRFDGGSLSERSCSSTALADINDDGGIDILIGAQTADFNSRIDSGRVYVVFGTSKLPPASPPAITPAPTPAPSVQARATLTVTARAAAKKVPRDGKAVLVKRTTAGPGQSKSINVKVVPKRARKAITVKVKNGPGSVTVRTNDAPKAKITVTTRATGTDLIPETFSRTWKVR